MAMRVPTVDGPSVAPPGLPGVRQSSIVSPDLLNTGARQVGALGEVASTIGADIQRMRQQQIAQANALRVDDAVNQAQEIALRLQHAPNDGFTSQTGYAALSRQSGMPLAEEYAGKLKESVDKIAGTLSNEEQRAAFSGKVNGVVTSFYGHALAHEATQQREYNVSVRDATVTSARNALSLNFTDPKNVEQQATRIRAAIEGGQDENGIFIPGSAQLQGKSAAWARERANEAISDAHGAAIKSALEQGNVNLAMAYFRRYGDQMTAKDVLEVQGTLTKDYDTRLGATVADQVFEAVRPRLVPNDYGRLTALVMGAESGGRRFASQPNYGKRADGTAKGSGFLGELKRLDGNVSTEISIGVNIGGKETEIPTLVPSLSKDEIDHLLSGGKPTEAIIEKAVTHAKARIKDGKSPFAGQDEGPPRKLLTSQKGAQGEMQVMPTTARDPGFGVKPAADDSPDELARVGRDYLAAMVVRYKGDVPKALAAYNAGPGAVDDAAKQGPDWLAKMPAETRAYVQGITAKFATGGGTPERPTLAELHEQARATLGPNASPLAVKNAEERLTQRFNDQDKAVKQRAEETVARAMQAVQQVGGRFSDLPASIRADLTRYAPDKVDQVMTYGARIAKGDDTTNPAVYLRLSDPATLRGMSEAQLYGLRGQLSEANYQHFANERAKLLDPTKTSNAAGDLNSGAVKSALDARLRELKIDPTPKDGSDEAARVGTIRRFVDEQVLTAQKNAGKKFTDTETMAFIDRLAATSSEMKGWFSTYRAPIFAAKPGDIPSTARDAIKAAFKKQGVDEPTDAQILNTFLHQQVQPKR